jgi:hypothetical protein
MALITLGANAITALPSGVGGKVLQVVQTVKTDTFSTTANSQTGTFADITGLSASITPSSTSNKILVTCSLNISGGANMYAFFKLLRDSTSIGEGNSDSSNRIECIASQSQDFTSYSDDKMERFSFEYLDSPSTTSAITFKVQGSSYGNTLTINKTENDQDETFASRTSSTITLMEIAG